MRSIVEYINEGLSGGIRKWLTPVLKSHINIAKLGNNMNLITIDNNKLNKPEKPFLYNDYVNDNIFLKIIKNRVSGFTLASQLLQQPNKYLMIDDNNSFKPDCIPYWYTADENNIYCAGLVMYDINNSLIENYLSIVNIEPAMFVDKSKDFNKVLLNDFINFINSGYFNKNFKGLAVQPQHPRILNIMQQLGFNRSTNNKNILIYNL